MWHWDNFKIENYSMFLKKKYSRLGVRVSWGVELSSSQINVTHDYCAMIIYKLKIK